MSPEVSGSRAAGQTQQASAAENEQTKPTGEATSEMPESVSSMKQLMDVSPEIYDEMMKAMFNDIKSQQEESQKRIKESNRQAYQ